MTKEKNAAKLAAKVEKNVLNTVKETKAPIKVGSKIDKIKKAEISEKELNLISNKKLHESNYFAFGKLQKKEYNDLDKVNNKEFKEVTKSLTQCIKQVESSIIDSLNAQKQFKMLTEADVIDFANLRSQLLSIAKNGYSNYIVDDNNNTIVAHPKVTSVKRTELITDITTVWSRKTEFTPLQVRKAIFKPATKRIIFVNNFEYKTVRTAIITNNIVDKKKTTK